MRGEWYRKKWLIAVPGCLFGLLIFRQYQNAMIYLEERTYSDAVVFLGRYHMLQSLQAVLAILVCVLMGRFIATATGYGQGICSLLMLAMYGLIGNSVLKDSVFVFPDSVFNIGLILLFFFLAGIGMRFVCKKKESAFGLDSWWKLLLCLIFLGILLFFSPADASELCLGSDQWMVAVAVTLSIGGASYLYFQKEFLLEISFLFAAFFLMDAFWEIPDKTANAVKDLWIVTYLTITFVYLYKRNYESMILLLAVECLMGILPGKAGGLPPYCLGMMLIMNSIACVCLLDAMTSKKVCEVRWKELGMRGVLLGCILLSAMVIWFNRREVINYSIVDGEWHEDGWLGKSVKILLVSGRESDLTLQFTNVAQRENMDITCSVGGKEIIYHLSVSGEDVIKVAVPQGKNIMTLTASDTYKPSGGDQRQLSVLFRILDATG